MLRNCLFITLFLFIIIMIYFKTYKKATFCDPYPTFGYARHAGKSLEVASYRFGLFVSALTGPLCGWNRVLSRSSSLSLYLHHQHETLFLKSPLDHHKQLYAMTHNCYNNIQWCQCVHLINDIFVNQQHTCCDCNRTFKNCMMEFF